MFDRAGRAPQDARMRIASLIASSTEIVCALGFGDDLVGRSHECDYPESVKRLPALTEPKLPTDGTSYEIDQRIKAILQEGLAVYRVFADKLEAVRPEVIVTQSQCEVCAVSLSDVEDAVCRMVSSQPRIVSLEPNDLAGVFRDIRKVAEALGAPERGARLVASLRERMAAVESTARRLASRSRVACIEWIEPLMSGGNWMPELVAMAGGASLFGQAGKHSAWLDWDDLRTADPDVVFVSPCGFDIPRTLAEMPLLEKLPGWHELRAVREDRVIVADGNQYFNRPGPRLVDSLEILAEALHPGALPPRHRGSGWVAWPQAFPSC
jgi:iron complex transport system substrate-binding protein